MAPSPRLISFLFLLAILSVQIHARESQFFSKVSGATTTPSTTTISNNNAQDKTHPGKEEEGLSKQEQDPAFIPDNQNGYGLYGQESTQFPTTTKLANAPYTTTTYQPYKTQTQNQESYTNYPTDTTTNTNTNYYNNNAYDQEQQQNFGETSLQESGYTNMGNQKNNYYYNGANSYSNDEKQGMSDTRYLEKGKYYYDLQGENSNYNPNQYHQDSRNNYNTRGYYNNNNENSKYEYTNSMQKYDNQDDFEESNEEQYVP
ncbi:PREDICTED: protein E6-like [Populus euphratica]|uniref:Protein E6-like n=1 Tax=Populus euphratica TaxID=75702 RepID=A0AAJ6X0U4_POPEU|nr:PREDICTED: protein E6-like [Populus euphratica]